MTKKLAIVFGVVFLLVGVLGFIPNPIISEDGLFHANTVHNLVHLISGIVFIFTAIKAPQVSGNILKIFGIVYLLVAILGFLAIEPNAEHANLLGIIGINAADNWLHLILGLLILGGGFAGKEEGMNSTQPPISQSMA